MRLRKTFLTLLFIVTCLPLLAQYLGSGSSSFSFLQLPMSARLNGYGGANVSVKDGNISMALNNPALLTDETHQVLNTNFAYLMENTVLASAIYGHNFGTKRTADGNNTNSKLNRFAAGIHYLNYGRIDYADEWGNRTGGTFSAHDMLINLIYTRQIAENISIGAAIKHVYSAYESYSSLALGADVGFHYHTKDSLLQVGVALQNIGGQLKRFYKDGKPFEMLPLNLQFGVSYKIKHAPLRFSVTFHNMQRWRLDYQYNNFKDSPQVEDDEVSNEHIKGIDRAFGHTIFCVDFLPKNEKFYLSFSYNHRRRYELNIEDQRSLAGIGLGAGLKMKKFRLDLALSQLTKNNLTIQVGLSLDFKTLLQ